MTTATIVAALQAGGHAQVIGLISTGVVGAKVTLYLQRCDADDDICLITFFASYNDPKKIVTDAMVATMNQRATIAKVFAQYRSDGSRGFGILYSYPCQGFEDSKFAPMVLSTFGADIIRVINVYNGNAVN